jgi:hypothetical protein
VKTLEIFFSHLVRIHVNLKKRGSIVDETEEEEVDGLVHKGNVGVEFDDVVETDPLVDATKADDARVEHAVVLEHELSQHDLRKTPQKEINSLRELVQLFLQQQPHEDAHDYQHDQ